MSSGIICTMKYMRLACNNPPDILNYYIIIYSINYIESKISAIVAMDDEIFLNISCP